MRIVLISGLSGSGKSIALNVIEDCGYTCVDNLPVELLPEAAQILRRSGTALAGLSIDARGGASVVALPEHVRQLRTLGIEVRIIFLDARNDALIRRFSETRRRHPLAHGDLTIEECLASERELLAPIAEIGQRLDTSELAPSQLRDWIKALLDVGAGSVTLLFESFAYKTGIPLDADLVFDVRCLPNPHYVPHLRSLSGRDTAVAAFLEHDPQVAKMCGDIRAFVESWLPAYVRDNRSYLSVAIGCTGGQHRSVYVAERVAAHFRAGMSVLVRHRELAQT